MFRESDSLLLNVFLDLKLVDFKRHNYVEIKIIYVWLKQKVYGQNIVMINKYFGGESNMEDNKDLARGAFINCLEKVSRVKHNKEINFNKVKNDKFNKNF